MRKCELCKGSSTGWEIADSRVAIELKEGPPEETQSRSFGTLIENKTGLVLEPEANVQNGNCK